MITPFSVKTVSFEVFVSVFTDTTQSIWPYPTHPSLRPIYSKLLHQWYLILSFLPYLSLLLLFSSLVRNSQFFPCIIFRLVPTKFRIYSNVRMFLSFLYEPTLLISYSFLNILIYGFMTFSTSTCCRFPSVTLFRVENVTLYTIHVSMCSLFR